MMEAFLLDVTAAERDFYGERLIFLEGIIKEFLSCMEMIRRYQAGMGRRDPVSSVQARIKSAASMKQKLARAGLPVTADSALREVRDAAGVRLICPFIQDIYQTAALIRDIPGVQVVAEKDYIHAPKPNGYRSLHLIVHVPVFLSEGKLILPVEVQIRTIAMDFWASLEHQLRYKETAHVPEELNRQLLDAANRIAALDGDMQHIHDQMAALANRICDLK